MKRATLLALLALGATGGAVQAAIHRGTLRIPVCQRTTSDARPYVRVVVRTRAQLRAHLARHADIVPVQGACPKVPVTPTRGGRELTANLSGADEKPSGDPDGLGVASVRSLPGLGQLCDQVTVSRIELPASAARSLLGCTLEQLLGSVVGERTVEGKVLVERVVRGHGGRGRVAFERFDGGTAELEYLTFSTKTAGLPYMASVIWPAEGAAAG